MRALLLALALCGAAQAADVTAAVDPAGPEMAHGGVPVIYFGVKSCGVLVIWLVMEDGHMYRLDQSHHPKDMEGFMKSIAGIPHDLEEIACPAML